MAPRCSRPVPALLPRCSPRAASARSACWHAPSARSAATTACGRPYWEDRV